MCYYISNNIRFIQGYGNLMETPASASHLKHTDAQRYISTHPDHVMMRIGSSKKKRNYVVSTKQQFIGKDGIVNDINSARRFSSIEEAYNYIDESDNLGIADPFVIDERYKKMKRPEVFAKLKMAEINSSRRIFLDRQTKIAVVNKSSICAICGKPISNDEHSIDHWVPLSRGGTNEIDNLIPVHKSCNRLKGDLLYSELVDKASGILCTNMQQSPITDTMTQLFRSFARGIINKYKI